MKKEDCFYLGHITKTVGLKAELEIFLDVDEPDNYQSLEQVFIEIDTRLVPYFLETIRLKNKKAVAKLEGVDELEQAEQLLKKDLYLPLSALPPLEGNKFYFHEVIGFEVIDENKGNIGQIHQILDQPNQALIQIKQGVKEILIPIHDEFIQKVDREKKSIHISTPEGLIDLYLND